MSVQRFACSIAVTADQPGAARLVWPGRGGPADLDALGMLLEARNFAPASHLNAKRGRPLAQDRLQALLVDPAQAPFGLALRIGSEAGRNAP